MSGFDPNLISSTSAFAGSSALQDTSAISNLTGSVNPFVANVHDFSTKTSAPIHDFSTQAMVSPNRNVFPANTLPENISAMDQQTAIAGKEAMMKQSQMNPFNAMMMGKQMLAQGQPQVQQRQQSPGQIQRGQQVNVSDSLGALLAPKLKKKQPISLL
jgi:hypothetical protein